MARVAISANSRISAEAGARIAVEGGNAVDAAVASILVSLVTEPGICSLGGGGFLTIGVPGVEAVTVDGYVEMPGRGLPPGRFGRGTREADLDYGGGVTTTVGHGSVATPGALAALGLASERFGRLPWAALVQPAYEWARDGFPLSRPARFYLGYAGESIFGWDPESRKALRDAKDDLLGEGDPVRIEGLAGSLRRIRDRGAGEFYRGEVARLIARDMEENDGILTLEDLAAYRPLERTPVKLALDGWDLALNPPPAIGGAALAAMLHLMDGRPRSAWTGEEVLHLVRVQEAVHRYRRRHLDETEVPEADVPRLLDQEVLAGLNREVRAGDTVHTSAVDEGGLACAVTISSGYGSGVMPAGTGIWMNNCLGERELNRRGFHVWEPGTRLSSNMAPTVGRSVAGATLAVGSPGADRITSALLQTLVNFVNLGMSLPEAVAHPRLHVELMDGEACVAHEPGLLVEGVGFPTRPFSGPDMFFGGVGAALLSPEEGFTVAADPRREGGTAVAG